MATKLLPLVSVLMTVYNREEYIAEAIESVMASTYQNWELIIVDDRSKDNSMAIAKSYQAQDERIKIFINEKNLGDYPNRNKAASYAKGKYLKYVDADDMIYPYGLEQLVYYMEQFPDAGYGLCSLEQDNAKIFPYQLSSEETYRRHYIEKQLVFHKAPLSSIINRAVFEKENGFAKVRHYGDSELWHRLSQKYPLVLMPHGIVWYRKSDGQEAAVRRKNPMNSLKTIMAAHGHVVSENSPLNQKEQSILNQYFFKQRAASVLFGYRKFGFKKGKEMKQYSGLSLIELLKYKLG